MAALNVTKCPSCNRLTPPKSDCLYCGKKLGGPSSGSHPSPTRAMTEEPRVLGNASPRFRPQADDRGHFLVAESREPVTLEAGKLFVLGRDSRTSLTIHGSDVSRQHAEIDWQGNPPRPVLCEVRSRNGTFLNDKLVVRDQPQPLRNGDRIRLGGSFTLLYLNVPERDLRRELQERSLEETRELRGGGGVGQRSGSETQVVEVPSAPPVVERDKIEPPKPVRLVPRPPGAPRRAVAADASSAGRRTSHLPSGDQLESLVAAAMGEAPAGLPLEGDLSTISGSDLLRQLVDSKVSGVLTVFEGTHSGEVVLAEGQCQQAIHGRAQGRPALQHIVRLRRGTYRFRPGDVTRTGGLDELPLPPVEEAPPDPLTEGTLETLSARDLVRALLQESRTGVLTIFAAQATGEASFVDGVCERAALAHLTGREALDAICALQEGAYRFRPDSAARAERPPVDDLTSGWSGTWTDVNDWHKAAPSPPPAPVAPPKPASGRVPQAEDPWEVDPDDTLMPGAREAFRSAQPRAAPVEAPAPSIVSAALPPPPPAEPAAAAEPAQDDPLDGDHRRTPPLRTKRYSPEPWSHTPLRGGVGPAPAAQQQPPPKTPRRSPPPLPPPRPPAPPPDEELA